ncbi:MAG: hypothetical protein K9J13_01725 [Saprospiraceae bacterium]|nr:hypothetical protein [Saprospiraceae bacterium]
MIIIADKKIPEEAKISLSNFGELIELSTSNITYEAISGHSDVFFCKTKNNLIVAPNLPKNYLQILKERKIPFAFGNENVQSKYPTTALYNAVVTENYLIHNIKITDKVILENTKELKQIHVKQAYTRCNLLPLKNDSFITSDKGIYQTLVKENLNVLFVSPKGILLEAFENGFFGGACGLCDNKVFIIGSLKYFPEGEKARAFLNKLNYEIIELYDGPLIDGGSLVFPDLA